MAGLAACGRTFVTGKAVNPDFRFERTGTNFLMLSNAFIHAGSDARNTSRRVYTQWVRSKPSRFSSVSTGS